MEILNYQVSDGQSGIRIDRYLSEMNEELSRSYIQKLLKEQKITVNGSAVKANYKVQEGDEISVAVPDIKEPDILPEDIPLDILYEDDDVLMKAFKNFAENKKQLFDDIVVEYRINPDLPSKALIEKAKKNLEVVMNITDSVEFFKTVDEMQDDLLDDAEDTAPVFDFFRGEQKKIFEKTLKYLRIFDKSKTYVRDQKVLAVVANMTEIVKSRNPYSQIQKLPELNEQFADIYVELMQKEVEQMQPIVEADFKIVRDVLTNKDFSDQFTSKVNASFGELLEKLKSSNEIAAVKNIKLESDALKLRFLDEIEEYEQSHQPTEPSGEEHPGEDSGTEGGTSEMPTLNRLQHRKRNERMCPSAVWQEREPILWRMNRILTGSWLK